MKPNLSALAALVRTLAILGGAAFFGALVIPIAADGSLPLDWAHWRPVLASGLGAAVVAEVVWVRGHLAAAAAALGLATQGPPGTQGPAGPAGPPSTAAAAAVKLATALLLAATLTGCLSSAPIVPVTPTNSAQIAQCESTAAEHNGLVIGDFVLTGAGGILGATGALASDPNTKTDVAITATVLAGTAVLASGLVAFTASDFATNNCSSVVGALPALPAVPPPPAPAAAAQ